METSEGTVNSWAAKPSSSRSSLPSTIGSKPSDLRLPPPRAKLLCEVEDPARRADEEPVVDAGPEDAAAEAWRAEATRCGIEAAEDEEERPPGAATKPRSIFFERLSSCVS